MKVRELLLIFCLTPTLASAAGAVICARGGTGSGGSGGSGGDILHETFDPTGYDNTWVESVSGGASVDEDNTTNPPVGSVTGFLGQAMRTSTATFGGCNSTWTGATTFSTSYTSLYFYPTSDSMAVSNYFPLITVTSSAGTSNDNTWVRIRFKKDAGGVRTLTSSFAANSDGTGCSVGTGSFTITPGNGYLIHLRVTENGASDQFEFSVNGTVVCSGSGALWAAAPQKLILGPNSDNTWQWDATFDTVDISSTGYVN